MTPEELSYELKKLDESLHNTINPENIKKRLENGIPVVITENGKHFAYLPTNPPQADHLSDIALNSKLYFIGNIWLIAHLRFLEEGLFKELDTENSALPEKEQILTSLFHRIVSLAFSITKLDSYTDYQSIAILSRTAFEIYVEMILIKTASEDDIKKYNKFIISERISYTSQEGGHSHWSRKSFKQCAVLAKQEALYNSLYKPASWYTHGYTVGTEGYDEKARKKLCGSFTYAFIAIFNDAILEIKPTASDEFINWLKTNPKIQLSK